MNLVCNLFVSTRPPRIRVTRPSATSRRCTCPALRCSPPSGEQALGWSGTSWARIILWISLTAFMEFVSILWYYCWRLSTWDLLPSFRQTKSLENISLKFFAHLLCLVVGLPGLCGRINLPRLHSVFHPSRTLSSLYLNLHHQSHSLHLEVTKCLKDSSNNNL